MDKHIERLLHDAHLRFQRQALRAARTTLPAIVPLEQVELRGIKVRASTAAREHPSNLSASYYKLFCDHDIPRWEPCLHNLCRRSRQDADEFLRKLQQGCKP